MSGESILVVSNGLFSTVLVSSLPMKYADPSPSLDFPKAKPVVIWYLWERDARIIMGQRAAQVKFTVVITIVQAVIAVFFGLFVRFVFVQSLPLISYETSINFRS